MQNFKEFFRDIVVERRSEYLRKLIDEIDSESPAYKFSIAPKLEKQAINISIDANPQTYNTGAIAETAIANKDAELKLQKERKKSIKKFL